MGAAPATHSGMPARLTWTESAELVAVVELRYHNPEIIGGKQENIISTRDTDLHFSQLIPITGMLRLKPHPK